MSRTITSPEIKNTVVKKKTQINLTTILKDQDSIK